MKFLFLFFNLITQLSFAQQIYNFQSIVPAPQGLDLELPATHNFQVLFQSGQALHGTTLPINLDFTGFVPKNGSSTTGYLSICHENIAGIVTQMNLQLDSVSRLWQTDSAKQVDFANVAGTERPCSGTVTPWHTIIHGEENLGIVDANGDGYIDGGWLVESDPASKTVIRKIFAAGRGSHENCAVTANQNALYTSNDLALFGFIFKYVFNQTSIDSSGTLYALQVTGKTGTWLTVPNTTITDRNNAYINAYNLGATNFNGVEDVEIAADNKIYFGSKASGIIFRFTDNDTAIAGFDTFVANKIYIVNTINGLQPVYWGVGIDNLAFDNAGNLWALQDGGQNYIWKIGAAHSANNPDVNLFARVPAGAEPTGITFTPDNKYMFLSIQHPYSTNTYVQVDAGGKPVIWNTDATLVIALNGDIGAFSPLNIPIELTINCNNNSTNLIAKNITNLASKIEWQYSTTGKEFTTFATTNNDLLNMQTTINANYFRCKVNNECSNLCKNDCKNSNTNYLIVPNTVDEVLHLNAPLASGWRYCIFDMYGKIVLDGIYNNQDIVVTDLPKGIYQLQLNAANGQQIKAMKFVKM